MVVPPADIAVLRRYAQSVAGWISTNHRGHDTLERKRARCCSRPQFGQALAPTIRDVAKNRGMAKKQRGRFMTTDRTFERIESLFDIRHTLLGETSHQVKDRDAVDDFFGQPDQSSLRENSQLTIHNSQRSSKTQKRSNFKFEICELRFLCEL